MKERDLVNNKLFNEATLESLIKYLIHKVKNYFNKQWS
ncbi:MAG: hypothetical protein ACJARO_001621 [Bacteriovoracaceae bacterium]|jgi:hypothetical protein